MQKIILDVIPNGVCPRVYVNQYDIGREFQISFKEGLGSYYFQNNLTFTINGRKSDNHIFEYTEADKWDSTHYVITKSGSGASTKVTIGTTEQMTAAPGETDVQLIFTDSTNAVIGTLSFIMVVQECPGIEGDPSESVVPNVVRSVNNVRPGATGNVYLPLCEIDGINDNVAYTEKTREMGIQHVAGEFVFVDSDNQLYEITSTINSGGTLTPGTNATACSIGDVLRQLNSDIAAVPKSRRFEEVTPSDHYNYIDLNRTVNGVTYNYIVVSIASNYAGMVCAFVYNSSTFRVIVRDYTGESASSEVKINGVMYV